MSNPSKKSISFNFEVFPFSGTSFSLREVGRPYQVMFNCSVAEGLRQAEVLAAVFLEIPSRERKAVYSGSVIQFIRHALEHPDLLKELMSNIGDTQLALFSQPDLTPQGSTH